MNDIKAGSSLTLAAAAAAMFALAPVSASAAEEATVKCVGGNTCKGHSACKTATSECKGLNACKGQGFVMVPTEAACIEAGGRSGPDTPTDPETPTEPETPGPGTQTCTYEHRIIGIPGTTANAYTGRILISSKMPDATASIRAYQGDNGHALDVLDGAGHAIGSVVSLDPANSIKRFHPEGAQGWHVVTITHATARAMHAASVVMRIRGPDGVQIVPIPPSEHCETASTPAQ